MQGETRTVRVDLDFGWRVEWEGELMDREVNSMAMSIFNYCWNKIAEECKLTKAPLGGYCVYCSSCPWDYAILHRFHKIFAARPATDSRYDLLFFLHFPRWQPSGLSRSQLMKVPLELSRPWWRSTANRKSVSKWLVTMNDTPCHFSPIPLHAVNSKLWSQNNCFSQQGLCIGLAANLDALIVWDWYILQGPTV